MSETINKPNQPNNTHASAAGTYGHHAQAHTPNQRELEARVLLKAAKHMQDIHDNWDNSTPALIDDALRYNRQIWLMFVDTAVEDEDPERSITLRNNIANLGVFIFNHTVEILADPKKEKLNVLIEINREIAAGLMTKPKDSEAPDKSARKATESSQEQAQSTTVIDS